jgi:WD40 repeat protein
VNDTPRNFFINGISWPIKYPEKNLLAFILLSILFTNSQTASIDQNGHIGAVKTIDWHPDGIRIASGSDDGTVKIWNTLNYYVIMRINLDSELSSIE